MREFAKQTNYGPRKSLLLREKEQTGTGGRFSGTKTLRVEAFVT